jgi:SAM-dependent methyltransferase
MKAFIPTKDRSNPKLWYSDYMVLRSIKRAMIPLARLYRVPKASLVVEVGAGTSPFRQFFLELGLRYVGVDKYPTPGADIIADGESLPFRDKEIDFVLHSWVLEHVENPAKFIMECVRILRPGGHLVFITHGLFPYHGSSDEYGDYWRWTHEGLQRLVKDTLGN